MNVCVCVLQSVSYKPFTQIRFYYNHTNTPNIFPFHRFIQVPHSLPYKQTVLLLSLTHTLSLSLSLSHTHTLSLFSISTLLLSLFIITLCVDLWFHSVG